MFYGKKHNSTRCDSSEAKVRLLSRSNRGKKGSVEVSPLLILYKQTLMSSEVRWNYRLNPLFICFDIHRQCCRVLSECLYGPHPRGRLQVFTLSYRWSRAAVFVPDRWPGRLKHVSSGSKGDRGGLRESDEVMVTSVGLSWLKLGLASNAEVARLGNIGVRKEQNI